MTIAIDPFDAIVAPLQKTEETEREPDAISADGLWEYRVARDHDQWSVRMSMRDAMVIAVATGFVSHASAWVFLRQHSHAVSLAGYPSLRQQWALYRWKDARVLTELSTEFQRVRRSLTD